MKISLLVPCYNEGKSLRTSIQSWLAQSRRFDEIVVVDDSSSDDTPNILKEYEGSIRMVRTPRRTGNKSGAQEYGLQFVTGDVFATSDGDTILDRNFAREIEASFRDPLVAAVGGYVKSLKYNWITACRDLDYAIGQNIDKVAQNYLDFLIVIPGAAGAFRTRTFRERIGFDHDTLTEDLDFTFKLHRLGFKIDYNKRAICYTQDPPTLASYINQMRRWYGGGWQNVEKHFGAPAHMGMGLELALIYTEGLVFSLMFLLLPFINILFTLKILFALYCMLLLVGTFAAIKERRADLLCYLPAYMLLRYVNSYIYLEQFFKEIVVRKRNMIWYRPERVYV